MSINIVKHKVGCCVALATPFFEHRKKKKLFSSFGSRGQGLTFIIAKKEKRLALLSLGIKRKI